MKKCSLNLRKNIQERSFRNLKLNLAQEDYIMPRINFSDSFTTNEQKIFGAVIASYIEELNLQDNSFGVYFDKKVMDPNLHGVTNSEFAEIGEFKILINSVNEIKQQLLTTAHEMIHVEQYVHGKMSYVLDGNPGIFWKGNFVPAFIAGSDMFYSMLPWEREAFQHQEKLYNIAMRKQETRK